MLSTQNQISPFLHRHNFKDQKNNETKFNKEKNIHVNINRDIIDDNILFYFIYC